MPRGFLLAGSITPILLAACASGPAPRGEPTQAPAAASSAPPAPASAEPVATTPAEPADGMVTIRGKSTPIKAMKLTKEGGEFYFYAHSEADEGIGIRLGAALKVGEKIERDRGVMGHVNENGTKLNVGDSSSFSFEVTKLELGTWEKPGKCSGRFAAEVKTKDDVIKVSGPFVDIECYAV